MNALHTSAGHGWEDGSHAEHADHLGAFQAPGGQGPTSACDTWHKWRSNVVHQTAIIPATRPWHPHVAALYCPEARSRYRTARSLAATSMMDSRSAQAMKKGEQEGFRSQGQAWHRREGGRQPGRQPASHPAGSPPASGAAHSLTAPRLDSARKIMLSTPSICGTGRVEEQRCS